MDNKFKKLIKPGIEISSGLNLHLFCKLSNINIGKYFLGLKSKHFQDNNPLRKRIYKINIKISYSSTNNILKIIDNHNKKLINSTGIIMTA